MASTKSTSTTVQAAAPITSFARNPVPTDYKPGPDCSGISVSQGVLMMDGARTCLPRNFNVDTRAFYSPGVQCPTGYTAPPGCSRTDRAAASITTVTCCPVRGDVALSCVADDKTLAGPFATLFCTWIAGPRTVLLVTSTDTAGAVQTSAATLEGGDGVNAFGIRMVYQSTDLAALRTTSATTTTATTPASGTDAAGAPTQTADAKTGLSTGAIVAIGVVIPLVLCAILGIALFFWCRKRRARRAVGEIKPESYPASSYQGSSYPASSYPAGSPQQASAMSTSPANGYYRTQSTVPSELHHDAPPSELVGTTLASELPADPIPRKKAY